MDEFGLLGILPEDLDYGMDTTLLFSDEELKALEIGTPTKKEKDEVFDDEIPW